MTKAVRTFRVRPSLPGPLQPLADLAANLRWSWDRQTRELFRWADPTVWRAVEHNPVALLAGLSPERLDKLAADKAFLAQLRRVSTDLERYLTADQWAQSLPTAPPAVAYFSPEFGLTHTMQVYSGGLGILAGDHLKAASDLGLRMVGVGLLYRHGYFRQYLDAGGWQRERYPDLNPNNLALRRLEDDGAPATVTVSLAGRPVDCHIWRADVGRVPLVLLDTDVASNDPADRPVTDRLYGGDTEHRIRQEIVLGIGGVRAVEVARSLGEITIEPELYHSNEGHAGFLNVERIRRYITGTGGAAPMSFDDALEASRSGVLFTTHTPVPAGIDRFPRDLVERYLGEAVAELGISMDRFMEIGHPPGSDPSAEFNMAVMGLRLSAAANGVSKLHGRVSREMFSVLWPELDTGEAPITSVTNGVHGQTWIGPEMTGVYERALAPDWPVNPEAWKGLANIGDDDLWRARSRARERMVQRIRERLRAQARHRGERVVSWTSEVLDPEALTIGFARRFAEYKRGALLLRQPERLRALLLSTDRPVQFVFAGKAHPRDDIGKDLIRQLVHFAGDPDIRRRLVFAEDYDMRLAGVLYQGVDVWLNNPRRPYEACGTSGEKAVLNGALHCSTFDGWWDEMYDGTNGFVIGTEQESDDYSLQDAADAESLYQVLEQQLVPLFYDRSEGPLPRAWLGRVRRSLQTLGPEVLASRMVREYTTELYQPLAERAARLRADGYEGARDLASWRRRVGQVWDQVRITELHTDDSQARMGERRSVTVTADLGRLQAADVLVELLHGPVSADGELVPERLTRATLEPAGGERGSADGSTRWSGTYTCNASGEYGAAVRLLPHHPSLVSRYDIGRAVYADDSVAAG